jgi:arsenate reductase (glutaredoxin)
MQLFHNPHCSKSRQTLQLLTEKGVEFKIVEYLKTPPNEQALRDILKKLSMQPRDLMRKGQQEYKDNNLSNPDLDDNALIQAMLDMPILIERPILISGNKAAIGRPPEKVFEII